jgi:phage terminase large subunit
MDDLRNVGPGPGTTGRCTPPTLGLMAICYEAPGKTGSFNRSIRYAGRGWVQARYPAFAET